MTSNKAIGFGFNPSESEHHFLVTAQGSKSDHVFISEHFAWDDADARRELYFAVGKEDAKMKVILSLQQWQAIADDVRLEFNKRLQSAGLKPARWKTGQTPIGRLFGKELVLLAWAIEEADQSLIPIAVKNWLGLAPEERWWLFTMTNAATGHAITGRSKGWRKAVRFALTENPVSDQDTRRIDTPLFSLIGDEMVRR